MSRKYQVFIEHPFEIIFFHLFSWEPFHVCRAFLTFTGQQKSIRVRETKILMVHQYFRPHQQRIQFYSERGWKFCSVCGFGAEPVLFSKTEALSRSRCQTLPLPLAATQPSPSALCTMPQLGWQWALPVWQDGGTGQFQPLSETLGQSSCPSALILLTGGTDHQ